MGRTHLSWPPFRNSAARLAGAVLFASGGAVAAWQTAQSPQFRTGVDIVEVDVTVLDRQGRPVTDLSPADFEIRERGSLQRIDTIFLVTTEGPLARGTPAGIGSPPALPRRPLQPRIFIFVFDLAHLSANGFNRSRSAVQGFLESGLRAQDLAGLVVNGEMLGNKIVSDKKVLLGLLEGVKLPNLSRQNDMRQWPRILTEEEAFHIVRSSRNAREQAVLRACNERPGDCNGNGRSVVEAEIEGKATLMTGESARDAQTTLTVLQTLASGLGRLPGPKQVVLFSEGFYTGEFAERVTHVAGLAAQNRVRISTLDARGLNTDPRMQNIFGEQPTQGVGDLAVLGSDVDADVLTTLALETGGERVRNRNDLRPALDHLATESGTYYMLGYSPQIPFDGSYRKIDVAVRRPDVTVRARRGYLAARPPAREPGGEPPPPAAPPGTASSTLPAAPTIGPDPGTAAASTRPRLGPGRPANIAALGDRLGDPSAPAAGRGAQLGRQGWDLYAAGKVEEARDRLAEAVAAGGGGVWVDYALGLAEFALRHPEAAVAAWQRVRTARPDYAPVHFDLADAYLMLDRTADALSVLREAARRWPADPDTHNAVGIVLVKRGAIDDAIESFSRAVVAAPDDDTGYFNLGRAYHLRYARRLQTSTTSATAARFLADRDRLSALEAYGKCVALGGPFEKQARDAVAALQWAK